MSSPGDVRFVFSHIYFDPPHFSGIEERVYGSDAAIDLATATVDSSRERRAAQANRGARCPAGFDGYLSLAAFIDNARGRKTPLNNAESARISTLTAMMGRKSIYERRVVEWADVDV